MPTDQTILDLSRHRERFEEALRHAFVAGSLKRFLLNRLGVRLDEIVGTGSGNDKVSELVTEMESEGRVDELFTKARAYKLRSPKLVALAFRHGLGCGMRAARRPREKLCTLGNSLARADDRHSSTLVLQAPPRVTRAVPAVVTGSVPPVSGR